VAPFSVSLGKFDLVRLLHYNKWKQQRCVRCSVKLMTLVVGGCFWGVLVWVCDLVGFGFGGCGLCCSVVCVWDIL
jgi:hypothetical protein